MISDARTDFPVVAWLSLSLKQSSWVRTYPHQESHLATGEVYHWFHLAMVEREDGGGAKTLLPDYRVVLVRCFHDLSERLGCQARLVQLDILP
jgi:hypothetical protein